MCDLCAHTHTHIQSHTRESNNNLYKTVTSNASYAAIHTPCVHSRHWIAHTAHMRGPRHTHTHTHTHTDTHTHAHTYLRSGELGISRVAGFFLLGCAQIQRRHAHTTHEKHKVYEYTAVAAACSCAPVYYATCTEHVRCSHATHWRGSSMVFAQFFDSILAQA